MLDLSLNSDFFAPLWILGGHEIWLIAVVVLVLFGGPKIPEFFRGLGTGITELKKGLKEGEETPPESDSTDSPKPDQS